MTGIPNFDHLQKNIDNDFPLSNYVLVATTPYRETFRSDDRLGFLQRCGQIAADRQLVFKLHPTEDATRATHEIKSLFPQAVVHTRGNVNHMIAKADVVITQQSTCTFVAVALGKETHSYLDLDELRRLMPIQNGGQSAKYIASISRRLLRTPMPVLEQIRKGYRAQPRWDTDKV